MNAIVLIICSMTYEAEMCALTAGAICGNYSCYYRYSVCWLQVLKRWYPSCLPRPLRVFMWFWLCGLLTSTMLFVATQPQVENIGSGESRSLYLVEVNNNGRTHLTIWLYIYNNVCGLLFVYIIHCIYHPSNYHVRQLLLLLLLLYVLSNILQ